MGDVNLDTVIAMNGDLEVRSEGDDGALLHDPATGDVTILNSSAAAVCRLLDGRRTVAEVVAALGEEFEHMGSDAHLQVMSVLRALVDGRAARVLRA